MFSIVIPTFNRATDLRATLASLATLSVRSKWEVIVVDNNSTDDTRSAVEEAAPTFPVELVYQFEATQGRSAALNAGIRRSRGDIIVTTDDDVRVPVDWLECAGDALDTLQCDYVGGRVLPIWGAPRPAWIPDRGGRQWAVIALLDYGTSPIQFFTLANRAPLGVNMAFRRTVFDRVGPWNNDVGRKKGTLLGQEVREWMRRAQAAGVRGSYAPSLALHHVIPADRLNKRYFRRWYLERRQPRAALPRRVDRHVHSPRARTSISRRCRTSSGCRDSFSEKCRASYSGWSRVPGEGMRLRASMRSSRFGSLQESFTSAG